MHRVLKSAKISLFTSRGRSRFRLPRGLLAQSVEQRTFNPLVAGSNPAQPTTIWPSVDALGVGGRAGWNPGLLAQLVEQRTLNPLVVGSNPTGPTNEINDLAHPRAVGFFVCARHGRTLGGASPPVS